MIKINFEFNEVESSGYSPSYDEFYVKDLKHLLELIPDDLAIEINGKPVKEICGDDSILQINGYSSEEFVERIEKCNRCNKKV